ncbi:hypothetical protein [Labrenzia sp. VG12]|uniref:hypothetical protein n=1 Tax=Labrenzia sp. VG12 TaxID=2021862 RepID=UPI000B8C4680|nr:hypothetical protein [Labrenzia sp. VG12]ASP35467.1 hypothetical protein CHH27_21305 [Labrenzia sp. VG12]
MEDGPAELTQREREACVQMLSSLLEEYTRDYLVGERGDTELHASIAKTAEALRKTASDKVLVAGVQSTMNAVLERTRWECNRWLLFEKPHSIK